METKIIEKSVVMIFCYDLKKLIPQIWKADDDEALLPEIEKRPRSWKLQVITSCVPSDQAASHNKTKKCS